MIIGPSGYMHAPTTRPAYGTAIIKCSKRKCGRMGYEGDLVGVPHKNIAGMTQKVCPTCGCETYFFATNKEIEKWEKSKCLAK